MDFQKQVQASGPKRFGQLIQLLNDSFQDLLYSHIDPVIKQWMKTFHNCLIIGAELASRVLGGQRSVVPATVCQVNLSEEQRERLSRGEETDLIEGLVSKKGNRFSAFLHLDDQGSLKFRFPEGKRESLIPEQVLGVSLNKEEQQHLRNGEETGLIRGLKGKRGIPFNAYLKMDAASKVRFRFEERNKTSVQSSGGLENEPSAAHTPSEEKENATLPELPDKRSDEQGSSLEAFRDSGIYGRKLETEEFDLLKDQGVTGLLDGFKTSSGKEFSARLEWKNNKLSIQIPQRQLDTGITMMPKKLFGVELSAQNRRLLAGGRSSELIQNMISPQGIKFDGWLEFNSRQHLCVRSAERNIQLRIDHSQNKANGMGPPAG